MVRHLLTKVFKTIDLENTFICFLGVQRLSMTHEFIPLKKLSAQRNPTKACFPFDHPKEDEI